MSAGGVPVPVVWRLSSRWPNPRPVAGSHSWLHLLRTDRVRIRTLARRVGRKEFMKNHPWERCFGLGIAPESRESLGVTYPARLQPSNRRSQPAAFTLIELLVVIAILA